jgi:hypothetical protein
VEHPSPSSASTSSSSGHRVEFRRASLAALYIPALNGGVFRAARINLTHPSTMTCLDSLAPDGGRKPWRCGVLLSGLFFVVLAVVAIFSGTLDGRAWQGCSPAEPGLLLACTHPGNSPREHSSCGTGSRWNRHEFALGESSTSMPLPVILEKPVLQVGHRERMRFALLSSQGRRPEFLYWNSKLVEYPRGRRGPDRLCTDPGSNGAGSRNRPGLALKSGRNLLP